MVALGANLRGEYASLEALLEAALAEFANEGLAIIGRSSWWRSAAWPDPAGPEYRNGVALVQTVLGPVETLRALRRIERRFGRGRGKPNAPRTLDLDLIAHGRVQITTDALILPHPRAHERLFVMGPLAEVAPDWRHPILSVTSAELAVSAAIGRDAAPV